MRARQVEALFDVPRSTTSTLTWHVEAPLQDRSWNVGLIVGASGSGKSTVARELFGAAYEPPLHWGGPSVLDDVRADVPVQRITKAFSAVGFGTIPAWLRPHGVLSTGERFRAEVARRLLELPDPVVVDEFTSVVDRQVAKVASHAIQKLVRAEGRQFVAVGCHYDVLDWLQPDWVLDMASQAFCWRSVQRRPSLDVEVRRVPYSTWGAFAPFHYLTADLNRSARCFAAHVDGRPVAFAGILHMPHPKVDDIKAVSRLVTLPDWQGLGLAFVLTDAIGSAYKDAGYRLRMYPSHPTLTRAFDRSKAWALTKKPGVYSRPTGASSSTRETKGRPCAVFEYVGPALGDRALAQQVLGGSPETESPLD